MRWRMIFGVVSVAGVLTMATACGDPGPGTGSGSSGDSSGQGGAGGGAKLTVTFDVEGALTLKGVTVDDLLPSTNGQSVETCAQYAKGGPRKDGKTYFVLPLSLGGDLDGKRVALNVLVRDYTGPGNYTQEQLTAEGGAFGVQVDDTAYVRPTEGDGSLVSTDAKGGGSFVFEKLTYANGGDLAGMISWTCES